MGKPWDHRSARQNSDMADGRIAFVELKRPFEKPRPVQRVYLEGFIIWGAGWL